MLDVSVVVPVRNAEGLLEDCLASIARAEPREIIVVDGMSTDRTLEIARRYTDHVLSDEGRGLPAARRWARRRRRRRWVALIDADVVLPDGSLAALLEEFKADGYTALQAGLHSVGRRGVLGRGARQPPSHRPKQELVRAGGHDLRARAARSGTVSTTGSRPARTSSCGGGWSRPATRSASPSARWSSTASKPAGSSPGANGARTARAWPGWSRSTGCGAPSCSHAAGRRRCAASC